MKKVYEIRIAEPGENWDTIQPMSIDFKSVTTAYKFCKKLAELHKAKVRVNESGSLQGHYFGKSE